MTYSRKIGMLRGMTSLPPASPLPQLAAQPFWANFERLKHPMSLWSGWRRRSAASVAVPSRLSLALQGGAAHGAFTWGVLDQLLADPTLHFDALSASSAGAVNAVVMTQGWIAGGRDGARQALSDFWQDVGRQIPWPLVSNGHDETISFTPAVKMLASWVGRFAPINLNPMDINPLRDLLNKHIDFERIRHSSPFKLFVGATHVNSGKLRLFREQELSVEMVLASSCLPKIHNTVEIDGEPYWDGGYSANPAVFPLVNPGHGSDILLVLLTPHRHHETPKSIQAIETRIQELGFKSHFLREMNMYARLRHAAHTKSSLWGGQKRESHPTRFHMIDASLDVLQRSETKMLAYTPFLEMLRDQGRVQAKGWLAQHANSVGKSSSVSLTQWLN
jgi:NTE family protein